MLDYYVKDAAHGRVIGRQSVRVFHIAFLGFIAKIICNNLIMRLLYYLKTNNLQNYAILERPFFT